MLAMWTKRPRLQFFLMIAWPVKEMFLRMGFAIKPFKWNGDDVGFV